MKRTSSLIGLLGALGTMAIAKDRPTYYTPERVKTGRENVEKYDWARNTFDRIMEGDPIRYYTAQGKFTAARQFVAQSDEFMWLLQPTTKIPRVYPHKWRAMCPIHGTKVRQPFKHPYSVWCPWNIDPIKHPYKVQCMMGKEWYPSNDYHKGDVTSGRFPDDGTGFEYEGKRFYPLREYAHMAYGSVVVPTLRSLSQAYLLTGEKKYAHKGCILLVRLASEYPNYDDRFDRTFLGPYGGIYPHNNEQGGMITDRIWETYSLEDTAYAYDALYDHIGQDKELIEFVKAKGMPIENADDLREYIETYIFRAGMRALLKGKIRGNEGMHQAAALACALVMDDYSDARPNSKDMVDYAYHGIGNSAYMLINGLTRDGGGPESPNYNGSKGDFIRINRLMEEVRRRRPNPFPLDKYPDLFAHPKAKELFNYFIDIVVTDCFYPSIGDCGGIRKPNRYENKHRRYSFLKGENLYAFKRYSDPRYAPACTTIDGKVLAGELWESYPAEKVIETIAKPESQIIRKTRILDGYGLAILESGEWPNSRAVTLNYSSIDAHRQDDQLTLGLYARGLDLLPDLGYPRTWDYCDQWDKNNMAHNTVTVNERPFTRPRFFRNGARLFASRDGVHVVTAYHNPYVESIRFGRERKLPCDLYERTVILVDVDPDRFYVVDLFAVNGGEQHDQSWHAMLVPPETPDLPWKAQPKGTLAGPEVAEFAPYTDRWGRRCKKGNFPSYLTDVRRATLAGPGTWSWKSGLPEGDTLHMHVIPVGGAAEVIMGRGRSPVWPKDEKLDYLLVRRQVKDGAASHFLTVLDGFRKTPVVKKARLVSERPLVLEITREDGVDQIALHMPSGPSRTTKHRDLGVRVSMRDGRDIVRDVRVGDLGDGQGPGYAHGTILDVDYENNDIVIGAKPGNEQDFAPGSAVRIYNNMRSSLFRIASVQRRGDRCRITLDEPALVARLPVAAVSNGRLQLGLTTPFITGHVHKNGELSDGANDYYHGFWLGEGAAARLIKGISNARPPQLHFVEKTDTERLEKDYVGNVVSIWHYGVGDKLEVARVAARHSANSRTKGHNKGTVGLRHRNDGG